MRDKYNPVEIEKNAQQYWIEIDAYKTTEYAKNKYGYHKKKFYTCSMLPYPSGRLHIGHVRNYTINDVMYRYLRMRGFNVLMPMGWDAFGMPAENAAIINNISPIKGTYTNIAHMKKQMQAMGLAIDWSREITTCDPKYYKWNQWMFLKMLEKGLLYKKTGIVNWDPIERTVLANEQVIDGRGWRSGALIEKREIPMYYARITKYADELLKYIETKLPGWSERVRLMQINWIGKSVGIRIAFLHNIMEAGQLINDGKLWVFTTRADTLMGVTFCVVAPEHPLAIFAAKSNRELAKFITECKQRSLIEAEITNIEKMGMPTDLCAIHPLTGEEISIWVGNYIVITYGDGAIMAVPGHDKHDFTFAKKYHLPIKQVIQVADEIYTIGTWKEWYSDKVHSKTIASGKYSGLKFQSAVDSITADLIAQGLGEKKINFRLRDWGISRQRYWGTPIPIICCPDCGDVPVPEEDLPVILPEDCVPDGSGNPLNKHTQFLHVNCPKCGKFAHRETDTMDTFIDSSWYYMRYISFDNINDMIDSRIKYWMPVDQYIGGIEHAVLHLLYARFWTKVMRDFGLIKFDEPFINLLTQGMVLNETYYRETNNGKKIWLNPTDIVLVYDRKTNLKLATLKQDGKLVNIGGIEKMSKSKNNGIDSQIQINKYGADTTRLFVMFASSPEQTLEWSDTGIKGAHRFLHRVWAFFYRYAIRIKNAISLNFNLSKDALPKLRYEIHQILQQADYDFKRIQYNTVVSATMKMFNILEIAKLNDNITDNAVLAECASIFLRVLNPIAPHITHILWQELSFNKKMGDILDVEWPEIDENIISVQSEIKLMIQINGKLRGSLIISKNANNKAIETAVLSHKDIQKFLYSSPKRIIIVPGKLVNLVI